MSRAAGTVIACDLSSEPATGREVLRILTDAAVAARAVYILPREPAPVAGDRIEWSTAHVFWRGFALRKIGYAFDPYAPLR